MPASAPESAPAAATGGTQVGPRAVSLPGAFTPYRWAATVEEVAARHGLSPVAVMKFDQNTPPLPGVPQVPLAESFATLNRYPDGLYRDLREAAAGYVSAGSDAEIGWEQIVVGAGADDLIMLCARTYLEPGRRAAILPQTYSLYRIATLLSGAEPTGETAGASLIWRCNPENPTGAVTPAADLVDLARANPDAAVVVDEAYIEFGGESVVPWLEECPNLVVLRTMSKAFGYAALRVGYAVAAPARPRSSRHAGRRRRSRPRRPGSPPPPSATLAPTSRRRSRSGSGSGRRSSPPASTRRLQPGTSSGSDPTPTWERISSDRGSSSAASPTGSG